MTRWRVVTVVVTTSLLGIGALAVRFLHHGPATEAAPPPPATTTITRQTLVDVVTANGKLANGPEQPLESRLQGTVTALPAVGATIARGQSLFRIDERPVVLFYGGVPAYRRLTAGRVAVAADPRTGRAAQPAIAASAGKDVEQFERNLRALGYGGFTVDEQYSAQTADAVRRWQRDLGLPRTGVVELGRVFYAPGRIRVGSVKAILGAVPQGPVLTYTSTKQRVTATLGPQDRAVARTGGKVTVVLPSGRRIPGTVESVRSRADDQEGGGEPGLEVVVAPTGVGGRDEGPVRVEFPGESRKNVLAVPVGALLALAEGGYGLEVLGDGPAHIVTVRSGLFAAGRVEVSGPGIRAGLTVGMAQ
ncbi:peptidoglycan-binding protein [Actinoplanes sp. NPDC049548]|uniref:peptidoglycan-binding protein n=1 Tax=Actinoplanes sp. NPDC049548 TaxID=3155152 RepID=UPI003433D798